MSFFYSCNAKYVLTWNFTPPPNLCSSNNCSIKFTVYFKHFQEERARAKAVTEELLNTQKKEFENFIAEQKVFILQTVCFGIFPNIQ